MNSFGSSGCVCMASCATMIWPSTEWVMSLPVVVSSPLRLMGAASFDDLVGAAEQGLRHNKV